MIIITVVTCQATDFKSALISAKIIESSFKPRPSTITFNKTRYDTRGVTPVIGDAVSIRLSDGTASYITVGVVISNISSDAYTVTWEVKDNWYEVYNQAYQTSWTVAKLGCDAFAEISRNTFSHTTYVNKHTTVNVNSYNTLAKKKGPCLKDVMLICMSSATISNWLVLLQYYGLQPTIWTDTDNLADKGAISQSSTTARLISAEWDDVSKYNVKYITVKYNGGTSTGSQTSSAVTGTLTVSNTSISNSTDADNYRNGLLKVYDVTRNVVKLQCVVLATANIPRLYDWYDVTDSTTGKSGTDLRVLEYEYAYPSGLFTLTMADTPVLPSEVGTTTTDRLNAIETSAASPIERVASKLTLDNTIDCVLTADASGGLLINGVLVTGTGDVTKSGSSAANQIPKWVGTGYTLAASGITIDASNNVASMGTLGCGAIGCGSITPSAINTYDLGNGTNYWNESFVSSMSASAIRPLLVGTTDDTTQYAQNTNPAWLRFRMSGASIKAGVLLSGYDSTHYFIYNNGGTLNIGYNTTITSGTATNIFTMTSAGNISSIGTLGCGAITSTGAFSNGSNTLGCGAITATSINASALPTFTTTVDGAVPNPGSALGKFLRDDATWQPGPGTGTLTGPASSTANAIVKWSNTGAIATLNSGVIIDSSNNITGVGNFTASGTVVGDTTYGVQWIVTAAASTSYRNTNDTSTSWTTAGAYTKRKEITMLSGLGSGTYKVYFEHMVDVAGGAVYSKVYLNGTAIGTERTTTSSTYVSYTEDFSGPLYPGDKIQIYSYRSGDVGYYARVQNFRIGYTLTLTTTMPSSNTL